jgi:hypothetical protein
LIALANQGRALAGLNPLDGPSQALPAVYACSSDFHDVTSGSNGYRASPGYDLATGLGTPIAVKLVGDLAFHVNSNYCSDASPAIANGISSHSVTAGSPSSLAMTPLAAAEGPSTQARPEIEAPAQAGTANSSVRERLLIGLSPEATPRPFQDLGRRHDHVDLALGSLRDDDLEFLRS